MAHPPLDQAQVLRRRLEETTRDLAAARARGVWVCNCKGCNADAVAEVAVMLMRFDGAYGSALFQLEVLQLVNQARADQGLAPLTADPALTAAAQTRAEELTTLYSHTRPDGRSCFTALTEAGVAYWAAGENIAAGYPTPAEVVAGWMASDGHRANILSEDFTQMGLGYAPAEDGYGHYWAQLFVG